MSDAVSVDGDDGEHVGEGIHGVSGSTMREEEDGGARGGVIRLWRPRVQGEGHRGLVGEGSRGWLPPRPWHRGWLPPPPSCSCSE